MRKSVYLKRNHAVTVAVVDDDDVLTLAHFLKVLAVVTKQAVTKMHLDGRKQTSTK